MGPVGPGYKNLPEVNGVLGVTGPMGPSKEYWFLDPDEMREASGPEPSGVVWTLEEYMNRNLALVFSKRKVERRMRIWINARELLSCENIPQMISDKYISGERETPDEETASLMARMGRDLERHGWTVWSIMII